MTNHPDGRLANVLSLALPIDPSSLFSDGVIHVANDYRRIHRLMQLIVLMQQSEAGDAATLADRLGVSERQLYRDLKVLADLGIPHYFDAETRRYRIRRDFFLPPVHLSASESLALIALAQGIGRAGQIAMTTPAVKAIEKIRCMIPARVLDELGDIHEHMDIQLPATGPAAEAIEEVHHRVHQAITRRRALRCEYESLQGQGEPFDFHPYVLSFDQRAWYAIGHHDGRDEVRRLKLNRFTSIQPTDKPYAIPDDFSLATFRGQAWRMIRGDRLYQIVIHFDDTMAETVADTHWHPTQDIEDHPDGSITYRCEVEGLDEILWWVLGYGPHARVIEPPELIERIAEKVNAAARLYA